MTMTNEEAKVYLQYIKMLLSKEGHKDKVLAEAIDVADKALGPDTIMKDPRFDW